MSDLAIDVAGTGPEDTSDDSCDQRARALAMRLRARLVPAGPAETDSSPDETAAGQAAPHESGSDEAGAASGETDADRRLAALPQGALGWLRLLVQHPVLTPAYEQRLARATGPDPFGLLELPPPPPFLDGIDTTALPPEHVAPLLRRISMTRPAPSRADLTPAALATDPGPVAAHHRTPAQQRWQQPPGAPLLPPDTRIPHIVHAIWLGGPVTPRAAVHANLAAAARAHHHDADFALWTDIPRAALHAADTTPPPPPGHPDPHAPLRDMLAWARHNHIHLISIHEVFHRDLPMNLHRQYTAETNKQLPRGYAAASDHLRLDIIYRLGGLYTDGDNHLGTTPDGHPLPATIARTLTATAASDHGFTVNVDTVGRGVNNDVIIAPARHPALLLWTELFRASYLLTQAELFGSLEQMNRWFIGVNPRWLRYTAPFRAGRVLTEMLNRLGIALDDRRLLRVDTLVGTEHETSWSWTAPPAPPVPPGPDEITTTLTRAITTLLRQLITRQGNLRLTAIEPAITALPDPDAAWTAALTLTAELTANGTAPPVTSLTQFRYNDNGTPHHVTLPPDAETLLNRTPPHQPWLGSTLTAPGHPAWLLDETVTPATLTTTPHPPADADDGNPAPAISRAVYISPYDVDRIGPPDEPRDDPAPGTTASTAAGSPSDDPVARAEAVIAEAAVMARAVEERAQEAGRRAQRKAWEQLTDYAALITSLSDRRTAAILTDAEVLTRAKSLRDGAKNTASARVLDAFRIVRALQDTPGADPAAAGEADEARLAAAAGSVAGLRAVAAALRGPDHEAARARWHAELAADTSHAREAAIIRDRIRQAWREARAGQEAGQETAAGLPDQLAGQILAEINAGCWPALYARLALIRLNARPAQAAAGVLAAARALPGPEAGGGTGETVRAERPGPLPFRKHAALAQWERAERARVLADRMRARLRLPEGPGTFVETETEHIRTDHARTRELPSGLAPGQARTPAGEVLSGTTVGWLRLLVQHPVLTPAYEQRLARATGPDPFGLLELPPPPPFLDGIDTTALPPEHVAPLLRRISMTRPAPSRADLTPAALATDPGPVAAHHRTPAQQRWQQPPGAPLLPPDTRIPHIVHAIWLGGPVTPRAAVHANLAAAARAHHHDADFALWTDIPRAALHAADTTPPPPPGHPDPHAPLRDMLAWARHNHIHLISIHEVFHRDLPMNLHRQYTAETNKQLPRGYAAASDHLRLDIIYRLGGLYTDGDNHLGTTPDGHPLPATIARTLTATAASDHGFTPHVLPGEGINNDMIIAPARHPAILLWIEFGRAKYLQTQPELYGGLDVMRLHYVGSRTHLLRHSVVRRTGRIHHQMLGALRIAIDDERLLRVGDLITEGSQLSWSWTAPPAPPVPPGPDEITTTLTRAITTLLRQLITRQGNLRLTAIEPAITALPDPDAAWTAALTLTAELTANGTAPPVTSLTQFRYNDNGTPHHVTLPPDAETLLNRTPPHQPWLGSTLTAPGHPAWLLDETVTPATLTTTPHPPAGLSQVKAAAVVVADPSGRPVGLQLPAVSGQRPGALPDPLDGHATIGFTAPNGYPVIDGRLVPPETLVRLLRRLRLHDRPLLLAAPVHDPDALAPLARTLESLLGQPVRFTRAPWPEDSRP